MGGITEILDRLMGPTPEEIREADEKQIARVRWAFNGEDGDSKLVNHFLDAVVEFCHEDSVQSIKASRPVGAVLGHTISCMLKRLEELEDLATTRVVAQGRFFTDKDGPDYVPPSVENPTDN